MPNAVDLRNLCFSYPNGKSIFSGLSLAIPSASRTLLVGANGVGKTTLLRLIAGRHLVPEDQLLVFGRSPFFSPDPASSLALVDGDFPLNLDIRVSELLAHRAPQVDPAKENALREILEVNPQWRMHEVSEGQRRRVHLLLALRKSIRLVLLDEVTTHLDVLSRSDFLEWLKTESVSRGLTIVYTTHVFDGLWRENAEPWPTHLAFLGAGGSCSMAPVSRIPELARAIEKGLPSPLLAVCEEWMRKEKA